MCTNILVFYVLFFRLEHGIKRVIVYCMQIGIFCLWLCTMVDFVNDPQRFVEGGVDVVCGFNMWSKTEIESNIVKLGAVNIVFCSAMINMSKIQKK